MHLAYIWIVSHLSAKNYRNLWKFDEVLTKTNLLSFFWDTVYTADENTISHTHILIVPTRQSPEVWRTRPNLKKLQKKVS